LTDLKGLVPHPFYVPLLAFGVGMLDHFIKLEGTHVRRPDEAREGDEGREAS
jgi:hypothetical protein